MKMSGFEIVGLITALSGIAGQSKQIFDEFRKDLNLPKTFEATMNSVAVMRDTLQACEGAFKSACESMNDDARDAMKSMIKAYEVKAKKIKTIFEDVMHGDKDGWLERYRSVLKRFGKGNKVEELVLKMNKDHQQIVDNVLVHSATSQRSAIESEMTKLKEIIEELELLPSSLPEENAHETFNSGGGPQTNNINNGNGYQNNGPGHQISGNNHTFNFGKA